MKKTNIKDFVPVSVSSHLPCCICEYHEIQESFDCYNNNQWFCDNCIKKLKEILTKNDNLL